MKKVIVIVLILAGILAVVGYLFWQGNPFSKEILKLEILGPSNASASNEITYTVKYKNNGDVRLEEPRLIFEFPEYTLLADGESRRVEIGPEELGDIYPGEEKTFQFKGRLLGKQGDVKTAKAMLSYMPKNLQARYESETTLNTVIDSVPLTFDFDLPSKVESGRDFDFSLNYFSSSDQPLTNLSIKIEYPEGFEFLSSKPSSIDKTEWEIPLLNRADGGRIEISGKLLGELKDHKIFKAVIGIWQDDEFIILKEVMRGTEITKPQLSVFQQINGQSNYVASPGDILHYEIFFRNISDEPFQDLFLALSLDGNGFDYDTIKVNSGQFQKGDHSIMWDWRNIPELKFLSRGEEGKVEFWVDLKDNWDNGGVLKTSILVSEIKEEFETKVNSKLEIAQKADYNDEVFGNSGPNPPEAGQETTYTVVWQINNSFNDVDNIRVRAILPPTVRLTGKTFPESESSKFAYDSGSREVVWMIGDVEKGASSSIAFQVALTPNSSQIGRTVTIVNEVIISGEDQWTEVFITNTSPLVKTNSAVK